MLYFSFTPVNTVCQFMVSLFFCGFPILIAGNPLLLILTITQNRPKCATDSYLERFIKSFRHKLKFSNPCLSKKHQQWICWKLWPGWLGCTLIIFPILLSRIKPQLEGTWISQITFLKHKYLLNKKTNILRNYIYIPGQACPVRWISCSCLSYYFAFITEKRKAEIKWLQMSSF